MRKSLEQYEAERGEDGEPFELTLATGEVVAFRHPQDMPFEDLVHFDAAKPAEVLRVVMGDEAFQALASDKRVTLRVLGGILGDYMEHFGMARPGEAAASPLSSRGSAGPSRPTSARPRKARAS